MFFSTAIKSQGSSGVPPVMWASDTEDTVRPRAAKRQTACARKSGAMLSLGAHCRIPARRATRITALTGYMSPPTRCKWRGGAPVLASRTCSLRGHVRTHRAPRASRSLPRHVRTHRAHRTEVVAYKDCQAYPSYVFEYVCPSLARFVPYANANLHQLRQVRWPWRSQYLVNFEEYRRGGMNIRSAYHLISVIYHWSP